MSNIIAKRYVPIPITHIIKSAFNSYKPVYHYKCKLNTGYSIDFKTINSATPEEARNELYKKGRHIALYVRRFVSCNR